MLVKLELLIVYYVNILNIIWLTKGFIHIFAGLCQTHHRLHGLIQIQS